MQLEEYILKNLIKNKKINTKLNFSYGLIFFLFSITFISGCSTKKNAFANKAFHYTTVKFNGYFHGVEALKLAKRNLYKAHVDNYEEILSFYRYGDQAQADAEKESLERAIDKASKMIDKHSMKFKKKGTLVEANKMIDDCYMLIGKAQFHKMKYDSAALTYKYMLGQFEGKSLHYPTYLELIKTYLYQGNFVDAETKFKLLEEDKLFPKKLEDELHVLRALYHVKSEEYAIAIGHLEQAIPETRGAKFKVRLKYILAQLYNETGDKGKAALLFEEVAKKAVFYEMEFNAKLSLAKTHEGGDGQKIIDILEKMIKDDKNSDFKDQIYYTLATVYEKRGKKEEAIKNYKLSARTSVSNPKQRALSYLALGNFHFEKPEYIQAQSFYDSSLMSLPQDYPNFEEIKGKADNLNELVENLNVVQREDSLLRLSAMTDEERAYVIDQLIEGVEEQEEKNEVAELAKLAKMKAAAALQKNTGGWIFYNPTLLASANAEFINVFGNRTLEDNWRRSDRTNLEIQDTPEEGSTVDEFGNEKIAENKTQSFYLKDIPTLEEDIALSNDKIEKALYATAVLFKDKLNDVQQSNYYFEELNKRYTKSENRAVALYQLYRNYDKDGNKSEAAKKKSIILSEFPNSEYAAFIKNPNKGAEKERELEQLNGFYAALLKMYQNESYDSVRVEIKGIKNTFGENTLDANFDLLDAFCVGKLNGNQAFKAALTTITVKYIGSVPAADALEMIEAMDLEFANAEALKLSIENKKRAFDSLSIETNYYAIIFSDSTAFSAELHQQIKGLIKSDFSGDSISAELLNWDTTKKLILIKEFKEAELTKKFVSKIRVKVLDKFNYVGNYTYLISPSNFSKLQSYKELDKYLEFHNKHYK